jgi:hypothetical protein
LAALVRRQLAGAPEPSRRLLQALAVLGSSTSVIRVGEVAGVADPSAALDDLLGTGLLQWAPNEPTRPLGLRHRLHGEAIYAETPPTVRKEMHARAATLVDEVTAWRHRVAAADRTDGALAAELEGSAYAWLAAGGTFGLAATWMQWAADLSETRADR